MSSSSFRFADHQTHNTTLRDSGNLLNRHSRGPLDHTRPNRRLSRHVPARPPNPTGPIRSLVDIPFDIQEYIMSFLPLKSLSCLMKTSKAMHDIVLETFCARTGDHRIRGLGGLQAFHQFLRLEDPPSRSSHIKALRLSINIHSVRRASVDEVKFLTHTILRNCSNLGLLHLSHVTHWMNDHELIQLRNIIANLSSLKDLRLHPRVLVRFPLLPHQSTACFPRIRKLEVSAEDKGNKREYPPVGSPDTLKALLPFAHHLTELRLFMFVNVTGNTVFPTVHKLVVCLLQTPGYPATLAFAFPDLTCLSLLHHGKYYLEGLYEDNIDHAFFGEPPLEQNMAGWRSLEPKRSDAATRHDGFTSGRPWPHLQMVSAEDVNLLYALAFPYRVPYVKFKHLSILLDRLLSDEYLPVVLDNLDPELLECKFGEKQTFYFCNAIYNIMRMAAEGGLKSLRRLSVRAKSDHFNAAELLSILRDVMVSMPPSA